MKLYISISNMSYSFTKFVLNADLWGKVSPVLLHHWVTVFIYFFIEFMS